MIFCAQKKDAGLVSVGTYRSCDSGRSSGASAQAVLPWRAPARMPSVVQSSHDDTSTGRRSTGTMPTSESVSGLER